MHAQLLREVARKLIDQPAEFASVFHEQTEHVVGPFYRHQIAADRFRIAEMAAARNGTPPPRPDPRMAALESAAARDPDVFRGMLETVLCMALPEDVMARPAARAAMDRYGGEPVGPTPGPDRAELLRLLAA